MLHIYTNGITHTYNQVSLSVIHSLITIFHYFNMHTIYYINWILYNIQLIKSCFVHNFKILINFKTFYR